MTWVVKVKGVTKRVGNRPTLTKQPRCPLESPLIKIALKMSKEGGLLEVNLLSLDKFIAADFLTSLKIRVFFFFLNLKKFLIEV